jgi:hypothetical protein
MKKRSKEMSKFFTLSPQNVLFLTKGEQDVAEKAAAFIQMRILDQREEDLTRTVFVIPRNAILAHLDVNGIAGLSSKVEAHLVEQATAAGWKVEVTSADAKENPDAFIFSAPADLKPPRQYKRRAQTVQPPTLPDTANAGAPAGETVITVLEGHDS